MNVVNDLFFELLQVAIGNRDRLTHTPSADEWEVIYEECRKQSLTGITFAGVERLPKEQLPPGRRIRQWAAKTEKIRERNEKVSENCVRVCRFFEENGFDAVILKGQANYAYYPKHLQGLRIAGDIDVWVRPKDKVNGLRACSPEHQQERKNVNLNHNVRAVVEFCLSVKEGEYVYYHNMDFPILKDTPIEVHYRPTWLYNPLRNRVLQRWFDSQRVQGGFKEGSNASLVQALRWFKRAKAQFKRFASSRELKLSSNASLVQGGFKESSNGFVEYEGYRIPSVEFDVVFQLLHLYKHIFEEGIGLRQLLDYYFVVTSLSPALPEKGGCIAIGREASLSQSTSVRLKEPLNYETSELIRKLGLEGFAGAVMYVMHEVFGMTEAMMLWKPDERRGRKLLGEIMRGGNFGKYDDRYNWAETTNGSMEYRGASYAFARLRHNMAFLWQYPSEVLWEPVFRVYHWVWRRFKLWRFE